MTRASTAFCRTIMGVGGMMESLTTFSPTGMRGGLMPMTCVATRGSAGGPCGSRRIARRQHPASGLVEADRDVSLPIKSCLKLAVAVILAGVGVVFIARQLHGAWRSGEAGAKVWFYDQGEKRLYETPRDTVPPDKGVGGPSGDGVRAVVVAFPDEQLDARKRRIAYLVTYSPPLKQLLDRALAARASGRSFNERIPPRDSSYFRTNMLVRRVGEPEWHPAGSAEGHAIMSEWRSWRGSNGQPPIVCLP